MMNEKLRMMSQARILKFEYSKLIQNFKFKIHYSLSGIL